MYDLQIREAVRTLLLATPYFDDVIMEQFADGYSTGTIEARAASIDPVSESYEALYDSQGIGAFQSTALIRITFLCRSDDPAIRDANLSRLLSVSHNTLNGANLLPGITVPGKCRFRTAVWKPPIHPERRVESVFQFQYLLDSWNGFDTSD